MTEAPVPPVVSIVIPHFDRIEKLTATLRMLLDQTLTDWEVIVVDDASPIDPTAAVVAIVALPRGRVIRLATNGGPALARNIGVAEARGRFIAFLDSDDVWHPAKLERQVAAASAHADPDRVLCYCRSRVVHGGGVTSETPARGIRADEDPADYLFLGHGFAQTSSLFLGRRAALAFGFDPDLRQYEDYLYFITARAHVVDYLFIEEALSEWNDEPRADRLSRGSSRSIAKADRFIAKAGALVGPRARLRFFMTHLGVDLLHEQPLRGLMLSVRAVLAGVVSPRYAARQCLRAALSPERFERLRGAR